MLIDIYSKMVLVSQRLIEIQCKFDRRKLKDSCFKMIGSPDLRSDCMPEIEAIQGVDDAVNFSNFVRMKSPRNNILQ